jgi:predicted aspartyl protease
VNRLPALAVVACALALPGAVEAQSTIYRWADERGVIHFSDRGVPGEYAPSAEERSVKPGERRAESKPAASSIPLIVRDGKRYVEVTLEGAYRTRELQMLVDTGAQMSLVDEEVADDLDLEFVRDVQIVGVSGPTPGWVGRLKGLKVGDRELPGLDVMVGPMPGLRLIGTDVLDELELTIGPDTLHESR